MSAQHVTLPLAFAAGLLSFASPCVLPLVPAYLGYLGGATILTAEQPAARHAAVRPFLHALFFVLGFGIVFVLLGATATLLGSLLFDYKWLLQRVGGVLLVVFGLRLVGPTWKLKHWVLAAAVAAMLTFGFASDLFLQGKLTSGGSVLVWLEESALVAATVLAGGHPTLTAQIALGMVGGIANYLARSGEGLITDVVPKVVESLLVAAVGILGSRPELFYTERRLELRRSDRGGLARSLLFGVVFAVGWTPCLGPILAAILGLASRLETVGHGALLLAAYTLGLGIPFLLVGLALGPLTKALKRANRYAGVVSMVSGALLVLMGILLITDSLAFLARYGGFFDL